jgi:hypothetical protein
MNWPIDRQSQYDLTLNLRHCTVNDRPVLSSERAPFTNKHTTVLKLSKKEGEKLVMGPRWVPDTKTNWPTDCRS